MIQEVCFDEMTFILNVNIIFILRYLDSKQILRDLFDNRDFLSKINQLNQLCDSIELKHLKYTKYYFRCEIRQHIQNAQHSPFPNVLPEEEPAQPFS